MSYEKALADLAAKVKAILEKSPRCHDWDHTARVVHNARILAADEPAADPRVVELGALLHDIARADELAIQGRVCHATQGAKIAVRMLKKAKLPDDFIGKVALCVRRHRFRSGDTPETIEERIVYDADKLDSVGAIGVGRAFHFAGRIGAKVHNTAEAAMGSPSYSEEDSAYREYLVKLRNIQSRMTTEAGRRMAEDRIRFMDEFFRRINDEVFGRLPESNLTPFILPDTEKLLTLKAKPKPKVKPKPKAKAKLKIKAKAKPNVKTRGLF